MTQPNPSDIDAADLAKRRSRDPPLHPPSPHQGNESNSACPFGADLQGYWDARHRLFSRFDEGIKVDRQGLHSLKFEAAAFEIGQSIRDNLVLDAFCGVGGSAIGMARAGKRVVAIELDESRLEMAINNAKVYGVADRITFLHGDAMVLMTQHDVDAVYLDPPWGGSIYIEREWFKFEDFQPVGNTLLARPFECAPCVALTLPLNFDLRQLSEISRDFFLRWSYFDGVRLFSTVYFGLDFSLDSLSNGVQAV